MVGIASAMAFEPGLPERWRAGEALHTPVNADPEYLRALFNTESTWAAAQTSETLG